jgi:hypothetical protein
MPSLVSTFIGNQLLEQVRAETTGRPVWLPGEGQFLTWKFSARHCVVNGRLSGGLVLHGRMPNPVGSRGVEYTTRLRAGWDQGTFKRAFDRMFDFLLAERTRLNAAAVLMKAANPLLEVPGFVEAIEAEEKRRGVTSVYEEMTEKQAWDWLEWVVRWQRANSTVVPDVDLRVLAVNCPNLEK